MNDKTFSFEPSGGLLNASLVMMDRETDSYWSIISEEAVWGEAKGTELVVLPGAAKTTFGAWRNLHPETLVLSINGKEHVTEDPYSKYFQEEKGFQDWSAEDNRLADKAHIYAFHWDEASYAVSHPSFFDGGVVDLGDRQVFLYRTEDDSNYQSTSAYIAPPGTRFEQSGGTWQIGGARFNPKTRLFEGGDAPEVFSGFDTFWYIWSLTNDGTELLEAS